MIVTAEGGIGPIFQEFWPDLSRKVFHRNPAQGKGAAATNTSNISIRKK